MYSSHLVPKILQEKRPISLPILCSGWVSQWDKGKGLLHIRDQHQMLVYPSHFICRPSTSHHLIGSTDLLTLKPFNFSSHIYSSLKTFTPFQGIHLLLWSGFLYCILIIHQYSPTSASQHVIQSLVTNNILFLVCIVQWYKIFLILNLITFLIGVNFFVISLKQHTTVLLSLNFNIKWSIAIRDTKHSEFHLDE